MRKKCGKLAVEDQSQRSQSKTSTSLDVLTYLVTVCKKLSDFPSDFIRQKATSAYWQVRPQMAKYCIYASLKQDMMVPCKTDVAGTMNSENICKQQAIQLGLEKGKKGLSPATARPEEKLQAKLQ